MVLVANANGDDNNVNGNDDNGDNGYGDDDLFWRGGKHIPSKQMEISWLL